MKAYVLTKTGPPSVLKIHEVPEPSPAPNEVKVRIRSIGINYAEILSRKGQYRWAPKRPYIPGMEAYGEIVAIGEEVKGRKIGEKVIASAQFGSYAEFMCTKDHLAFPALANFSAQENAAFLVNFMTAWVALVKLGKIREREKVLIQAAAGGVGTAAVKIAKAMGCFVYGTASQPEKISLLNDLGVDLAINYAREPFDHALKKAGIEGVDMVLEVVGGEVFRKSVTLLNPFGRIVVAGFASNPLKKWNPLTWWKAYQRAPKARLIEMAKKTMSIGATHIGYLSSNKEVSGEIWEELKSFVQTENLSPVIGAEFDFDRLPEAHQMVQSRRSFGKVIVNF